MTAERQLIGDIFDNFTKEVVGSFIAPTGKKKRECRINASGLAEHLVTVPEELQPILRLKLDGLSESNHDLAKAVRRRLNRAFGKNELTAHRWWE